MMKKLMKILKIILALVLVVGVALCIWMFWVASKVVDVEVAAVAKGDVTETIETTGTVAARNVSVIMSKGNVDIIAVAHKAGDTVEEGELLISTYTKSESIDSEIMSLRSQITGLTAGLEQAESDIRRLSELYDGGAVSKSTYDTALTGEKELRSQLAALEFKIRSLQNSKQSEDVSAPVSGKLTDVFVAEGDTVMAGRPLAEITDMKDVYLKAELTLDNAKKVKKGNKAICNEPGLSAGEIVKIPPKVSEVLSQGSPKKRIDVEISFESGDDLIIGDEFDVSILVDERDDVIRVPRSAVFLMNQRYCVYLVTDNRLSLRELSVGLKGRDYYEVLAGLEGSETLVISPGGNSLSDGMLVRYAGDEGGSMLSFLSHRVLGL